MNAKAPLIAGLVALLFLTGKKGSKKAVVPAVVPPEQDIPKEEPKKETPSNGGGGEQVITKTLTASQKEAANMFINNKPLVLSGPVIWHSYASWRSQKELAGQSYLYQEWLTNQIYWHIARKEKKSDWDFAANVVIPLAPLPFILKKGEKVNVFDYANGVANTVLFVETPEAAAKRLAQGIALWNAILKYVTANLKVCPVGAYCGLPGEEKKPIDYTLTPNEKLAADYALQIKPYWDVETYIVPEPQNKYTGQGSKADWLTSVAYWVTYRDPNQEFVKSGKTPAPITPVKEWIPVWVRLNKYISSKMV